VLWQAVSSCKTPNPNVEMVGDAMIDTIFDNADNSRIGDAGCPL
jgi:hypothetical protein